MRFKKVKDGYLDDRKGLIWQKEQCEDGFSFDEAIEYCKFLGDRWRLPTVNELASIIDYGKYYPATYLPDMMSSDYWSSTTYTDNKRYAWLVYFKNGYVDYSRKSGTYYVRAVKDFNSKPIQYLEKVKWHRKREIERSARIDIQKD